MKSKKVNLLMIIITALVIVYYFLNFTGFLILSNNPTIANEPNLKLNSKMLSSNLIEFKRGDFIVYKFNDEYIGKHKRVHRLIAIENDTLEIRDGIAYLNNVNIDKNLNLVHYFKLDKKHLDNLYKALPDYAFDYVQEYDTIFVKALIEDFRINELNFQIKRLIDYKGSVDEKILSIYHKPWNKDNFGPIIIPVNKVFVLGDNRDNTYDSRNIGLIDKVDVVGTILTIF